MQEERFFSLPSYEYTFTHIRFHFCIVISNDHQWRLYKEGLQIRQDMEFLDMEFFLTVCMHPQKNMAANLLIKGCVCYIFGSLFCISKREHSWNKGNCFLFHFRSFFRSWDHQILNFKIFKCHDVIKCLSMKHKTHFID